MYLRFSATLTFADQRRYLTFSAKTKPELILVKTLFYSFLSQGIFHAFVPSR